MLCLDALPILAFALMVDEMGQVGQTRVGWCGKRKKLDQEKQIRYVFVSNQSDDASGSSWDVGDEQRGQMLGLY